MNCESLAMQRNLEGERAVAFGRGCEARLAGKPIGCNPFTLSEGSSLTEYSAFQAGWREVNDHYASDRKIKWPVRPLVPVVEEITDAGRIAL